MNTLELIPAIILIVTLGITWSLYFFDKHKRRKTKFHPFITFAIPCYNERKDIETAIKSVHDSYDNFEMIVVDDKSKDDSLAVLKKLKKKYKFKLISNKKNLGQAETLNKAFEASKGEIFFALDADSVLTKKCLNDILKRFGSNPNVGGVSCPYKPLNNGLLARMQHIEYNASKVVKLAQNFKYSLFLWGACLATKREAFAKVGGFSKNAITNDIDLALKIIEAGYKVEQSSVSIATDVPTTVSSWFDQKKRWTSGGTQCFLTHTKLYFKNPVYLMFSLFNLFLFILFSYNLIFSPHTLIPVLKGYFEQGMSIKGFGNVLYNIFNTGGRAASYFLLVKLGSLIFWAPYLFMTVDSWKESYKLLYVFPFMLIYYPIYTVVYIFGAGVGVKKYFELKKTNRRAW